MRMKRIYQQPCVRMIRMSQESLMAAGSVKNSSFVQVDTGTGSDSEVISVKTTDEGIPDVINEAKQNKYFDWDE